MISGMRALRPYLKFLVKMRIVAPVRSFFLALGGAPANREKWEERLLIINLQALGDLVVFTSVLKHYKKRFPDKKIYLLTKKVGLEKIFLGEFADQVITLDYPKFAVNPAYGVRFINRLRRIGFRTVVNQDWSAAEIMGSIIATSVGAEEVVGYEGLGSEFVRPFDIQQVLNLHIVTERLYPRFTKIIPSLDAMRGYAKKLPSAVNHYRAIYEGFAGVAESDYALEFPARVFDRAEETLKKFGIRAGQYAVVNVNASMPFKRWPLARYAEIVKLLRERGLTIALVGSKSEMPYVARFETLAGGEFVNLAGRTTIEELVNVVANARIVITNDTSLVHISVAAKAPMVAVIGGGHFGMFSGFGYLDIHRWVYHEMKCFGDNWTCSRDIGENPAPCLDAVSTEAVLAEVESILDHLKMEKASGSLGKFNNGYEGEKNIKKPEAKWTVVYAGAQAENYNPDRFPSFERTNFLATLAAMPEISVIEAPFDPIVGTGKRWWNKKMRELVEREKPDLVFAFMLSDEFERQTLDAIKKTATSVAWFSDDHWRLDNYSRHWTPHFTHAVTTWSRAPQIYKNYGIEKIICSQWAATVGSTAQQEKETAQDIEVSFIGQRNPARAKIVNDLRAAGINVVVRGFGWPEGRVSQEEAAAIIARSKINLNFNTPLSRFHPRSLGRILVKRARNKLVLDFHFIDNVKCWWRTGTPQIKARPFEILARDAFLISGYADDVENYYADKKEIIYYDGTTRDLVEKIKYYLAPERAEDRRRIARAGYERTLHEHTYEKRFREIFSSIGLF